MDAGGRLRLDAVARYLQDVASEDVAETGWGSPGHLWVVRRTRVEVVEPIAGEQVVELATWCSGIGGSAAARRTRIAGNGQVDAESVWIHLDGEGRPSRVDAAFAGVYGEACGGRRVSTRFELVAPVEPSERRPWPLRAADVDLMAHVNNAAYWAAVEELLALRGPVDRVSQAERGQTPLRAPNAAAMPGSFTAVLEYRRAIDLGEDVELAHAATDGRMDVAFLVAGEARAIAAVVHNP